MRPILNRHVAHASTGPPDDYVIGSGEAHTVANSWPPLSGMSISTGVSLSKSIRPISAAAEVDHLLADTSKARPD